MRVRRAFLQVPDIHPRFHHRVIGPKIRATKGKDFLQPNVWAFHRAGAPHRGDHALSSLIPLPKQAICGALFQQPARPGKRPRPRATPSPAPPPARQIAPRTPQPECSRGASPRTAPRTPRPRPSPAATTPAGLATNVRVGKTRKRTDKRIARPGEIRHESAKHACPDGFVHPARGPSAMTSAGLPSSPAATTALPAEWRSEILDACSAGEMVLEHLELDLADDLRFAAGIVVLTNRRLLAKAPGETAWRHWEFRSGRALDHRDHAGVGTLELRDESQPAGPLAPHPGPRGGRAPDHRTIPRTRRRADRATAGSAAGGCKCARPAST